MLVAFRTGGPSIYLQCMCCLCHIVIICKGETALISKFGPQQKGFFNFFSDIFSFILFIRKLLFLFYFVA